MNKNFFQQKDSLDRFFLTPIDSYYEERSQFYEKQSFLKLNSSHISLNDTETNSTDGEIVEGKKLTESLKNNFEDRIKIFKNNMKNKLSAMVYKQQPSFSNNKIFASNFLKEEIKTKMFMK
jgi:hypothetical protein